MIRAPFFPILHKVGDVVIFVLLGREEKNYFSKKVPLVGNEPGTSSVTVSCLPV